MPIANVKNYEVLIDIEDLDLLKIFKWHPCVLKNGVYIRKTQSKKSEDIYLHRMILQRVLGRKLNKGELVDHQDTDPLNNQRGNLRLASHSKNHANEKLSKNNTSGFKGVRKRGKKWRAEITVNRKKICLGCFSVIEDAVQAYKEAAIKYFGEFARF